MIPIKDKYSLCHLESLLTKNFNNYNNYCLWLFCINVELITKIVK